MSSSEFEVELKVRRKKNCSLLEMELHRDCGVEYVMTIPVIIFDIGCVYHLSQE